MTASTIDINADLGEGGAYDAELYGLISSANIACGVHAGDPETMRASVRRAIGHGVAIGAHPSVADRAGFGREWIETDPETLRQQVAAQIQDLQRICGDEGAVLAHVKAHGALYNRAAVDEQVAIAVARAIEAVNPSLLVFAQPGSRMEQVATRQGLPVVREAFADRAYAADGTLVSRGIEGSVLHDPAAIAERVLRMITTGTVTAIDGQAIPIAADTICIHSDTPGAVAIAATLREVLTAHGIVIRSRG